MSTTQHYIIVNTFARMKSVIRSPNNMRGYNDRRTNKDRQFDADK